MHYKSIKHILQKNCMGFCMGKKIREITKISRILLKICGAEGSRTKFYPFYGMFKVVFTTQNDGFFRL